MPGIDLYAVRADDLRFLVALANTGRLVAAAAALGVDHSTVSRRIRALEKVLRARLIERGADGWELTETGRAVAEHARPIQKAVEQAAMAARGARPDMLTGTIRITAPDGFGTVFVVPALTQVRKQHPNLNVELITATRQLSLYQSGFDLAIAVGKPEAPRYTHELLPNTRLSFTPPRPIWDRASPKRRRIQPAHADILRGLIAASRRPGLDPVPAPGHGEIHLDERLRPGGSHPAGCRDRPAAKVSRNPCTRTAPGLHANRPAVAEDLLWRSGATVSLDPTYKWYGKLSTTKSVSGRTN